LFLLITKKKIHCLIKLKIGLLKTEGTGAGSVA
jgi:hypothetical protein